MCIDYRQLNNNTKKDSYALPRIEELLDSLGRNTYFTKVDMKSGYHQVEILEQHKKDLHVLLDHWDFMNSTEYPLA
jgi:hypothetical protein